MRLPPGKLNSMVPEESHTSKKAPSRVRSFPEVRKVTTRSFLVQELKRVCYEGGSVPAARCNPKNIASRKTLQNAGFVPCGHILNGTIAL